MALKKKMNKSINYRQCIVIGPQQNITNINKVKKIK